MNISPDGLKALEDREGSVPTAYKDSAGYWTIGVGHLLNASELHSGKLQLPSGPVEWADGLTADEVAELLEEDLALVERVLNTFVTVPLLQTQYDALVSFIFNVGTSAFIHSTLLRLLNDGQFATVPAQLGRWIHSAGRIDSVLVARRNGEITQWEATA